MGLKNFSRLILYIAATVLIFLELEKAKAKRKVERLPEIFAGFFCLLVGWKKASRNFRTSHIVGSRLRQTNKFLEILE